MVQLFTVLYLLQTELKELDEKFRKAMITNAQLDNEKATLTYEVELMKDRYTELEEAHTQLTVSSQPSLLLYGLGKTIKCHFNKA